MIQTLCNQLDVLRDFCYDFGQIEAGICLFHKFLSLEKVKILRHSNKTSQHAFWIPAFAGMT